MLKSYKFSIKVYDAREEMGRNAAEEAGETLRKFIREKKEVNCIFAAAPSQNEFLKYLVLQEVEWSKVNVFHMDEYIGLEKGDVRSFSSFLIEKIFGKFHFKSVNTINGDAKNINREIERYSNLLNTFPVDITFMGIGENGHIAFNDPHIANFHDVELMKIVDLDLKCRMQQVHDGCFQDIDQVPKYAVTLTIPALMRAEKVFCVVPSETKAEAVKNTIMGEISVKCPATIMRRHFDSTLFLDNDSAKFIVDEIIR